MPEVPFMPRGRRRPYSVWICKRQTADGRSYRIQWVDPVTGRQQVEACGTDTAYARDRREAKAAELRNKLTGNTRDRTLSHVLKKLGTWQAGKSAETRKLTRTAVERLIAKVGDCRLQFFDRSAIMEYRAARLDDGVSPATVNKDIRSISSALSLACDAGWLPANPCWHWRAGKLEEVVKLVRVVEPDEFARIIDAAKSTPILVPILQLAYYQGPRRASLCALLWEDVDLERRVIRLTKTKTGRGHVMPLRDVVCKALSEWKASVPHRVTAHGHVPTHAHVFTWPDGRPLLPDWLSHAFAALVISSGVRACTLHDLRRSFSTLAQRAGLAPSTVQALGGWKSLAVVKRHYTGDIRAAHRIAMDVLDSQATVYVPTKEQAS